MHHQRGAEKILQRKYILDARRARQHQQDGEQAGADQRHQPQPQPGPGKAFGRPPEIVMICEFTIYPAKKEVYGKAGTQSGYTVRLIRHSLLTCAMKLLSDPVHFPRAAGRVFRAAALHLHRSVDGRLGQGFQPHRPHGKAARLADFRGKAVVMFFGYTQCPDVCPTTLSTMREAMTLLGDDARRVQVLFVTVDPARDTPAIARAIRAGLSPELPRPVCR
jgi:hypothetical protein